MLILITILGGLVNRIRGFYGGAGKIANDIIYGFVIFFLTFSYPIALISIPAMSAGRSFGWGDYIGALFGYRKTKLKEVVFIDFLIKPLINFSIVWGFIGLSLRGLVWSLFLALPLYFYIGSNAQFLALVGLSMGVTYKLCRMLVNDDSKAWALGERVFGSILWGTVATILMW